MGYLVEYAVTESQLLHSRDREGLILWDPGQD